MWHLRMTGDAKYGHDWVKRQNAESRLPEFLFDSVCLVAPEPHTCTDSHHHRGPASRLRARLNPTALCDWYCSLPPTSIQGCTSTVVLFRQGGRGGEFPFNVPDEPLLTATSLTGWGEGGEDRGGWRRTGNKEELEFSGSSPPPRSKTPTGRKSQTAGSRRATMSTLTWYKLFWMSRTSFGNSFINCWAMTSSSWMMAKCSILWRGAKQTNK